MNAVFALLVLQQTGFATPITISEKDVTLPEICNEIGVKSGLKIDLDHEVWNDKVTVFVKDMPAKDLLDRLSSLYDLDGSAIDGRYRIKLDVKNKKAFEEYVNAEFLVRMTKIWSRLRALAKLTLKPFGDKSIVVDKNSDEATQWAQEHIGQPKYYAAGMWVRVSLDRHPDLLERPDNLALLSTSEVHVFWVGAPDPPTPPNQTGPWAKNYIDGNSRALDGTAISISCYETTGELCVSLIPGKGGDASDFSDRPFLFAQPPPQLRKSAFAVRLADWQTPVDPKVLGEGVKGPKPPDDPGYFDGRISLSEKLQNLHNRTGVPIVATSFRTPALVQNYTKNADPADLLSDIQTKEETFLRWDKDCLLVRHPAYWILQCSEPPEQAMRKAESIAATRPMTFFEYAGLTQLICASCDDEPPWLHYPDFWARESIYSGLSGGPSGYVVVPRSFERLPKGRGFLSRFDPEPLERAFPVLAILGSMDTADQERFSSGEKLDAGKSWISGYKSSGVKVGPYTKSQVNGRTVTGTTTPPIGNVITPVYSGSFNLLPDFAADLAPLFPATISDSFLTPIERRGEMHIHASEDSRGRMTWLDWADGNDYRITIGTPEYPTVTYDFAIHPNPPR